MKSLLILYPIQPYADVLMGEKEFPEIKLEYARIYQRLIVKRYPDFQLIWMMFSQPLVPKNPEINRQAERTETGSRCQRKRRGRRARSPRGWAVRLRP